MSGTSPLVAGPVGFLGLPSLHSIVQAIAGGFFGALASALVPGWLKHGTIATIQQLVALPDPATWGHVGALQGEMTYLGAMLAPVTLAVGALRYWAMGLTGSAHPVSAVTRCAGATAGLVTYRWGVEQVVAGTNTLTHGILGLPSVTAGLQRIITVLFGGALLSGAGGVFGAFLVIVGVVFAAGLFAAQVLLTVVLALLIVVGPPLIALAAIPELSHLARAWRDALLAVALIPLGWTALFATAGALCLDATSFTGGAGGLPGHVAAAFAGLITFALAVKLPFVLLGELRGVLARASLRGQTASATQSVPGADRVRSAHARLRSVGLDAVPALGASVGRAAGALGTPAGGPLGAARRSLVGRMPAQRQTATDRTGSSQPAADTRPGRRGPRERLRDAGAILAAAPAEALRATRRQQSPRAPYPRGGTEPDRASPERARQTPDVTPTVSSPEQGAPSRSDQQPSRASRPPHTRRSATTPRAERSAPAAPERPRTPGRIPPPQQRVPAPPHPPTEMHTVPDATAPRSRATTAQELPTPQRLAPSDADRSTGAKPPAPSEPKRPPKRRRRAARKRPRQ